jgi:hypothetical protein
VTEPLAATSSLDASRAGLPPEIALSSLTCCSIARSGASLVGFEMEALELVMNNRRQHYTRQHQKDDTG